MNDRAYYTAWIVCILIAIALIGGGIYAITAGLWNHSAMWPILGVVAIIVGGFWTLLFFPILALSDHWPYEPKNKKNKHRRY